jgi:hypothetical protein
MSAAAARRRKQLAARTNVVGEQLTQILATTAPMDEAVAYEALQLAQSMVRKKIASGLYTEGCDLCYTTAAVLLQKGRVSVASQLLTLLVQVLLETHTSETDGWWTRLAELHETHGTALQTLTLTKVMPPPEVERLLRLHREWLLAAVQWSADLGTTKYGHVQLHKWLGEHCWKLASFMTSNKATATTAAVTTAVTTTTSTTTTENEEFIADLQCEAIQHLCLAEEPTVICQWLAALPAPTEAETTTGHTCPPALRDGLLTRAVLLFCALQNLRDANTLVRTYCMATGLTDEHLQQLAVSYTDKNDGKAPAHVTFCCMLLRILEKDVRTGPLYTWLLRSFKRSELDRLHRSAQTVGGYVTKIGKVYFHIQPPPNMLSMMESMMGGMMGGGGGGINPAMMQAAMAQLQQGGMM